jgi:hypothetical protein
LEKEDYNNNGYDDNAIKLAATNGYGTSMVVSTGMLV